MRSVFGRRLLGAVGAVLFVVGVVCTLFTVYLRIRQGRGTEGWVNVYGQPETWAGAAGALIGMAFIALVAFVVVWVQLRKRSREEGIPMRRIFRELKQRR